jgi:hypothetical protein
MEDAGLLDGSGYNDERQLPTSAPPEYFLLVKQFLYFSIRANRVKPPLAFGDLDTN